MTALKCLLLSSRNLAYSFSSVTKALTILMEERASCAIAATIASFSCMTLPTSLSLEEALSITRTARGVTTKVTRVSFQFIYRRKNMIPTKVKPWTTKSTTTDARIDCSVATSFVILERNSPDRLLYSLERESLCVWSYSSSLMSITTFCPTQVIRYMWP